jgi:hypothetical protein
MSNYDTQLLEEAYLSISKKLQSVPSDKEAVTLEPNSVVSAGPVDEPAPGVDMDMIDSEVEDVEPEDKDTPGIPVSMITSHEHDHEGSCGCDDEEDEFASMAIDNLNSVRESVMKIAMFCATGNDLDAWQHQKLAIAMDNLAEIARRLR